jgi:hypothetical protein
MRITVVPIPRQRFRGAGASAERKFNSERRENVRALWYVWVGATALAIGLLLWSFLSDGTQARVLALSAGMLIGVLMAMWALGGNVTTFHWWQGAEGERETARQLERLGTDWHCEHDIEHPHGNFDHVLIGPPGVFLLDTKTLSRTATAKDDQLAAGRLRYPGGAFRGAANTINKRLERQLGHRCPWVQAVVVIWGDFPQQHHQERDVVYIAGDELVRWIEQLPGRTNGPQRAALVTALQQTRHESK